MRCKKTKFIETSELSLPILYPNKSVISTTGTLKDYLNRSEIFNSFLQTDVFRIESRQK